MGDGDTVGQRDRLAEVDQPDADLVLVVDKQEGAPDKLESSVRETLHLQCTCKAVRAAVTLYLVRSEELRLVQGLPDV